MKNVATLADVSFKTVSRVVNGEPGVSRQLEERVTAAIAELGYQPDHGARNLRRTTPQSATVG
ncbi:LacI family DNA-binding transcriptional regulator, partial [bacterium]|nr:LacI family DNA-binding transcriptional regulator [bacterium]